mgnify:CR=1 FL=1
MESGVTEKNFFVVAVGSTHGQLFSSYFYCNSCIYYIQINTLLFMQSARRSQEVKKSCP